MGRHLRRRIALTVALAAVLAGGTAVALGATGGGHDHRARTHHGFAAHRRGGVLHVAASYLGLSPEQLREQLRAGKSLAQVADSTPGKSEAGLVAALLGAARTRFLARSSDLEARVKELVNRAPGAGGHVAARGARRVVRTAVLSYLGIRGHDLVQQLRAGRTLAQIADSTPGKSSAGLGEAIHGALTAKVNAAVATKHLDKKAQSAQLARLSDRVTRLLNRIHRGAHHVAPTPSPSG